LNETKTFLIAEPLHCSVCHAADLLLLMFLKKTGRRSGNKELARTQPEKNTSSPTVFF
jgi:hypothetical protein